MASKQAKHFRLRPAEAAVTIDQVVTVVRTWRTVPQQYGLGRDEQQRIS